MSEPQPSTSAVTFAGLSLVLAGKKARSKSKQPKPEKGTRRPRALSAKKVAEILNKAGVEDKKKKKVSGCVKAGIARRFIQLETAADLDKVLVTGTCSQDLSTDCTHKLDTTLKMLLYQKDTGVDEYYGCDDYAARCGKCNQGYYVSGLCAGEPSITDGKFYNHCTKCPVFGKCVGDVRNKHCKKCGKHFFAGSNGNFRCGCSGAGRRRGGRKNDCNIM